MDQRLQTSKTIHQLRRGENNIPAGVNGPLQVGWRQNDVLTPNFPSAMLQGNSNLEKLPLPTTMSMTMTPLTPMTPTPMTMTPIAPVMPTTMSDSMNEATPDLKVNGNTNIPS